MRAPRVRLVASALVAVGAVTLVQLPAVALPGPSPTPPVASAAAPSPSPSDVATSPPARSSGAGKVVDLQPPPRIPAQVTAQAPDLKSARKSAKQMQAPVEVLGKRTATSSTFVEPSGLITLRTWDAPVHVLQGTAWVDADTTMHASGGVLRARTADAVVVSTGGPAGSLPQGLLTAVAPAVAVDTPAPATTPDAPAAAAGPAVTDRPAADTADLLALPIAGTAGLTVGWSGLLPPAVVNGATSTFPRVAPGVDLRVDIRLTGTELSAVLADRVSAPQTLRLPLRGPGLRFRADGKGGLGRRTPLRLTTG